MTIGSCSTQRFITRMVNGHRTINKALEFVYPLPHDRPDNESMNRSRNSRVISTVMPQEPDDTMPKKFIVRCYRCVDGDFAFDDLPDLKCCPNCDRPLGEYESDGIHYCWLHGQKMAGYRGKENLRVHYVWVGHEELFPNAKLFEDHPHSRSDERTTDGYYCDQCQVIFKSWLAENG